MKDSMTAKRLKTEKTSYNWFWVCINRLPASGLIHKTYKYKQGLHADPDRQLCQLFFTFAAL
jgi:hypothetical protein